MRVNYKAIILVMAVLLLQANSFAQNNNEAPPAVQIPGSQLVKITSSIVSQEYNLLINLPGDYQNSGKTYPVLFLLDAQWDFPLLAAIHGQQYYDGYIPGIIVVGITWGGGRPNHDSLRARDLTPTNVRNTPQSGNAARFLSFIKNELVPFIDSRYRTNKFDRTLVGSSLGGLFTTYAFLNETALFNRYVLTSPALGWGNEAIYSYVKDYEEKRSQVPVRMYVAIGDMESGLLPGYHKWLKFLEEKKYKGVTVQGKVLENTGHSGSKAEGYTRGMQFVYEKPSLKLASTTLDQYTGSYQLGNNVLRIAKENDQLVGIPPGNNKIMLHAETENDFYAKGQFLFMHFKKDNAGKITGFQLERYGGGSFAKKID